MTTCDVRPKKAFALVMCCLCVLSAGGALLLAPDAAALTPALHVEAYGPRTVVQGYPLLIGLNIRIDGAPGQKLYITGSALPLNSIYGSGYSLPDRERVRAKDAKGYYFWGAATTASTAFQINTAPTTPPGRYTVIIDVANGNKSLTKTLAYEITVAPHRKVSAGSVLQSNVLIPNLSDWEDRMIYFGRRYCSESLILSQGVWDGGVSFYDGIRVFYQIADYTYDPSWEACAGYVQQTYRDNYVLKNNGSVVGWRIFPEGLYMDYMRTADPLSKDAVILLSKNASFNIFRTNYGWAVSHTRSREVAYNIEAAVFAERLGEPHSPRLDRYVDIALGHLDQWTVARNASYIQPFMVGLTAEALITYYDLTKDPRILPAVKTAMDYLWDTLWSGVDESFPYMDRATPYGGPTPAPNLNLLIAPAFAWIFHMTGDATYQERGDQIFSGGVRKAYLGGGGKHFSQNYRWSFDYVKWRTEPTAVSAGIATAPATINLRK